MSANPKPGSPVRELRTARLVLSPITDADIAAVVETRRQSNWAADFPSPGDEEIAGLLSRTGLPVNAHLGHRLVLERGSGQLIGGVGFFGPPDRGRIEIGYGIVQSRRRRGYATEAVIAMVQFAFTQPDVAEVVADVDQHPTRREQRATGRTRRPAPPRQWTRTRREPASPPPSRPCIRFYRTAVVATRRNPEQYQ